MDIVPDKTKIDSVSKPELELVEREKQEYKLIGRYIRTKGLKLYSYNSLKDELKEVEIRSKSAVDLVIEDNQLVSSDSGQEEVTVDSRNILFEALNLRNARKKIQRYKEGKIKDLCNLKEYDPKKANGIKLF